MSDRFVGVDVGTSATKAIAVDRQGRVLATRSAAHETRRPRAGFSEQDPEDWVASATAALQGLGGERAAGLAFSGQMHGLVLLDGRGRVLRPAILWNDGRAARERAAIVEQVGSARLLELVANLPPPGATAASLLWVREHEPDVWSKVRRVLLPKDYVRWRLAGGEPVTDLSDASGALLFDVRRRRWSAQLLDLLELPAEWFPDAVESTAAVGQIDGGTVVAAGAGDQAAAVLGVGLRPAGEIGIAVGTSGVVVRLTPASPPAAGDGALQHLCACAPRAWQTMGVTLAAGGSLAWWQRCCGGADTETLLTEAARCEPGCDGLLFHPYLSGERAPLNDETVRGAFTRLAVHHDRGAMTRAVVEGIACSLAEVLDLVSPRGRPPSARISGGLARSPFVREVIASLTGLELLHMEVSDSTAYGAALLAGIASGGLASFEEAADLCAPAAATRPVTAARDAYADVFARYRQRRPTPAPSPP